MESPQPRPWTLTYVNPCTGEQVELSGTIQESYSYYRNHDAVFYNIHLRGETATGVRYVATETKIGYTVNGLSHLVLNFRLNRVGDRRPGDDEVSRSNIITDASGDTVHSTNTDACV